jgi:hypothetical protein
LGFSQRQVFYYVKKYGREIVDIQDLPVYACCGISTHYAVRPRHAGESDKPIYHNRKRTNIYTEILKTNRETKAEKGQRIKRLFAGKSKGRFKQFDTYQDIDLY